MLLRARLFLPTDMRKGKYVFAPDVCDEIICHFQALFI